MDENKKFMRGAKPTPPQRRAAIAPFALRRATLPTKVAYIPKKMTVWGNDQFGDCVSAEEAFNKDVQGILISDTTVIGWARQHGFLNGAMLDEVMDAMAKDGFHQDGHVYGDGGYKSVDYSREDILKAALAVGVVKIAMDANALPSGAGNQQGWYRFGGSPRQYSNIDHCTALCGYGTAAEMFAVLGIALPAGVDPNKPVYLHFTWGTIGVVDHDWIMSCVEEAYLRDPGTTVDGQPQPNPGPKPAPAASVQIRVSPTEVQLGDDVRVDVEAQNAVSLVAGNHILPPEGGAFAEPAANLGLNTIIATAVGADGQKVTASATYNVVPKPQPAPTPTPSKLPLWAIVAIGAGVIGLAIGAYFLGRSHRS